MNVVDSSAWLEYFADGPNAGEFAKAIESTRALIVPTLSLFEVFKRIAQQRNEDDALRAVAIMEQGRVVDLDRATAVAAARLGLDQRLAIDRRHRCSPPRSGIGATLWTQAADFEGLPGVRYFAHR